MDLGAIIAGVGTLAGSLGGALGWLGGRRKSNAEAGRVDAEARASEWQLIIATLRAQSDRDREQHARLVAQLQATIASQAQGLASWSALYQRTKSEVVDEQRRASAAERDRAELERQILEMAGSVASHRPDAMTVMCTNLKGAQLAARIEEETGIPLYDSVSTVVWKSLLLAGFDVRKVKGWGGLFQNVS